MDTFLEACRAGDIENLRRAMSDTLDLQQGLLEAIKAQSIPVIGLLLERGVSIDHMSFIAAAREQSEEVYACFIAHGWDVNSTEHGSTALRYVQLADAFTVLTIRLAETPSMAVWLIDHGADPNVKSHDRYGEPTVTNMSTAMATNDVPIMKVLLAHGALLEKNLFEPCLAPWFDEECPAETLQFLIDSGLDPNVIVERGNGTPLQLAARRNLLAKVKVLLQAGADCKVTNETGQTPLDEAKQSGNAAMIELLQRESP